MKLEWLSGLELGDLVNRKEISPVEVIEYFRKRIDKLNPKLTAFVYTKFDEAILEAKKLENLIMQGEYVGPFAGVPTGLKDFLPSKKGWTNSHGGVKSLIAVDDADSEFYKAARKLGSIAIGKTNAPPFGFKGTCDNALYGPTCNPYNLDYNSGGSSGGTAAAVAAGFIPFGEGGDAGGSIRIPSAWCNCFGFKPGIGSVPSYCRPDGWAATHPYCFNGAITRTVDDSIVLFNSMNYFNRRDPLSLPKHFDEHSIEYVHSPIRKNDPIRVGVTLDFNLFPVDSEIAAKVLLVARDLLEAGADVGTVHFNFKHSLREIADCWAWAISVDTSLDVARWKRKGLDLIADHSDELTEEFIYYNNRAYSATVEDFRTFNEIRTDILDQFESAFDEYDVILSPVTCCMPLTNASNGRPGNMGIEGLDADVDFIEFGETLFANFVGYPAASVPSGFSSDGLPIGVQVIGKKYHENDVLRISYALENIRPWNYTNLAI